MNKISFVLILLLISFSGLYGKNVVSQPHAYITKFAPYVRCSPKLAHQFPNGGHMPTWVDITFSPEATEIFARNFFGYLQKLKPTHTISFSVNRHKKGVFTLQVPFTMEQAEVESMVIQANRHFDPNFKTPQEIAAQAVLEEVARKKSAAKERAEQIRQKAEEEKLKIEQEGLRKEAVAKEAAERREKVVAETLRIQKEAEEQQRLETEREAVAEACHTDYQITALPANFCVSHYQGLNNHGQVAGYIGANAVFWDPTKGLVIFPKQVSQGYAPILNDNGFVCVSYDNISNRGQERRIGLWNPKINEFKSGPVGSPEFMNQNNTVLLRTSAGMKIWNPQNNTLTQVSQNTLQVSDDGTLSNFYSNKNGARLVWDDCNHTLLREGKHYLLLPTEGHIVHNFLRLNDNDEVVGLSEINKSHAIVKWHKNGQITRSKIFRVMPALKRPLGSLAGFNNKGQVLLYATGNLFLLTPKPK